MTTNSNNGEQRMAEVITDLTGEGWVRCMLKMLLVHTLCFINMFIMIDTYPIYITLLCTVGYEFIMVFWALNPRLVIVNGTGTPLPSQPKIQTIPQCCTTCKAWRGVAHACKYYGFLTGVDFIDLRNGCRKHDPIQVVKK